MTMDEYREKEPRKENIIKIKLNRFNYGKEN